eukprot:11991905-Alexandrium_andersonii.AAC.1
MCIRDSLKGERTCAGSFVWPDTNLPGFKNNPQSGNPVERLILRHPVIRAQSVIRSPHSEAEINLNVHPPRTLPGDSASLCALNPMVVTNKAGKRPRCAFRGVRGGGAPPGRRNASNTPPARAGDPELVDVRAPPPARRPALAQSHRIPAILERER